ncbi:hypothetical protein GCM10010399_31380 [Dactylosporangium fulvum]|uniref:Type IV toxin-antitoxin system AbiEi family antitoxin domain-containing protein n=1 Tax=Dactylosporangium fulvum TaxID=53359 RepID=A0ABY5W251_9ACTN|nr:type IV toxin-antitoxin system AbiEi family antitoxin domain-containing protein [Dactylosporangium fulvum]UWP84017.1 type IV toxin-antitoxin system AbiEi family antitoxin domain-containing protein [Dactylosporangium fulvum]
MLDELLKRQAGVVTRAQALAAGLRADVIRRNVDAGRWVLVFRGVYRTFTGEPTRASTLWAVLLRAGSGAALSHRTAAELHGLVDKPSDPIHVTIPAGRRIRPMPGVVVHHRARIAVQAGSPLRRTRVEETVLDLCDLATRADTAVGWITTACGRRLTTPERILDAVSHRKQLRWRRLITAVLDDTAEGVHSVLERRYLRDVERGHRLPPGRRQAKRRVGDRHEYRDVLYDGFGTVVELDGRAYHPEERRSRDRQRDNESAAVGERTLRYGWADVTTPCPTASQVARALRAGGWRGQVQPCKRRDCTVRRTARRRFHDPEDFTPNSGVKSSGS